MQLDKYSDYALRILIALAAHAPDKLPTVRIAAMYGISNNHLSKIATELARNGFIQSERGRAGGLTLAMPAADISIGGVLRSLKRDVSVAECFGSKSNCAIVPACGLRSPLVEAQDAFFAVLDGYKLADVTRSNDMLKALLSASNEID
ncbi:Rrf2 family transcriptional regulator [Planktotalea sp.]|uniref:RrF2 family transcriptional regulator n=1 Tax=Planktotalea sp. TaxID=2029877 RepID=UPI003299AD46